jgi:hypothetical protein
MVKIVLVVDDAKALVLQCSVTCGDEERVAMDEVPRSSHDAVARAKAP